MMFILYDFISLIIFLAYVPSYILRRKFHRGFSMRLGFLSGLPQLRRPIWIHAVSVGEIMALRPLIEEMKKSFPRQKYVISTVTATGNKIAHSLARKEDYVFYLPLDFSFIVEKVIRKINPCLFIVAETEIWPNLINSLSQKRVPVMIVNGRISDKSFKGYKLVRFILKPILKKISIFCMQTLTDQNRLLALGVDARKVVVSGNLKFDLAVKDITAADQAGLRAQLGLAAKERVWIAASTHPGEEEIILRAYRQLLQKFPGLRLVIAPRHPQRAGDIEKICAQDNFNSARVSGLAGSRVGGLAGSRVSALTGSPVSGLNNSGIEPADRQVVFILDTIGQLLYFYAIADIVFVAGSLIKKGGHNIIEPATLGKPVIFGPWMFNFRDICELFLEANAGIRVNTEEELIQQVHSLLEDPARAEDLGRRSKAVVTSNRGATLKVLAYIKALYSP